jgi:hypothetical protein
MAIDRIDQRLRGWITTVVGKVPVFHGAPNRDGQEEGVGLYLFDIAHHPIARDVKRATPRRFSLRYLITTWSSDPVLAHRWLGALILAALETKDEFEMEQEPLPMEFWLALGSAPCPNLRLRAPLIEELVERTHPLVRSPLIVRTSPLRPLRGRVLGPGGEGLMGARVELPSVRLSTRTDAQGRFEFASVPAKPALKQVRIQARGKDVYRNAGDAVERGEPLTIQLEESEV